MNSDVHSIAEADIKNSQLFVPTKTKGFQVLLTSQLEEEKKREKQKKEEVQKELEVVERAKLMYFFNFVENC